jgi:ankyrin repeat protein
MKLTKFSKNFNFKLKNKKCDLDCVDTFGNTALHLAANRNQCELAILLTQKGINTLIKNKHNLTALDLAKTNEMKEIWRKIITKK